MAISLDQVNTLAAAIFRSRERSEHYELRLSLDHLNALVQGTSITKFPFRIHNTLAKKGEIKMERMNFFGGNNKSKENTKSKKKEHSKEFKELAVNLASKIGVTKAAEELGVSTSSIYSWQKSLVKSPTPVQNKNSNLTFSLEGRTYSLNVNSEEERKRVKKEVNANSLAKYDWFKEVIGKEHWVLYNTEIYEIDYDGFYCRYYLHYKEDCDLNPVIPINATSCYFMFYGCKSLTEIDLSNFDTSRVTDMCGMFSGCKALTQLDLSSFNLSEVNYISSMFRDCVSLTVLDLSNFDTFMVKHMDLVFFGCKALTTIYISDKWNIDKVKLSGEMFGICHFLPNFSPEKTNIKMAKPIEQGGYLTLKK